MLGREFLIFGRYYWEVEVGERVSWVLGVCRDNVNRKEKGELFVGNGFWILVFLGSYYNFFERVFVFFRDSFRRVGIFLDYEAGYLFFYSVIDGSFLYVFFEIFFLGIFRVFFSFLFSSFISMIICRSKGGFGDMLVF